MLLGATLHYCSGVPISVQWNRAQGRVRSNAMSLTKPVVGQWYRGANNDLFEVVAID